MSQLFNLQNIFQDFLLNAAPHMQDFVVNPAKVPATVRLNIYRDAYQGRLLDCLGSSYPMLQSYMGDELFDMLASQYIHTYPSFYRSIRWYGDQLPHFIKTTSVYEEYPYLFEFALFEWTLSTVFDAADSPILLLDEMHLIPLSAWENMCFSMHPSVHRLNLHWNIPFLWQALFDEKEDLPDPEESEIPLPWIFWRKDLINQFCSLTECEAEAIDAAIQGHSFGTICEGISQWMDAKSAPLHAASLLKGWIVSGLITNILQSS